MTAYLEVYDERFQDREGKWISLWMTYHRLEVIRAEWICHLSHKVIAGEKSFEARG